MLEEAGAPPEALVPLMRRTIENGFELTGPISRGDWATVDAHLAAIHERAARARAAVPRARGGDGAVNVCGRSPRCARLSPAEARRVGLVPTMGAFHAGHLALFAAARAECDLVVVSLFVNPAQFGETADLATLSARRGARPRGRGGAGVDLVFAPSLEEMYPPGFQTWVEVTELGAILEGEHRPGHFRGVATVCLKLFTIVRPDVVYFGQKDAQQVEVVRRLIRDLALAIELRVVADRARRGRPRALLAQRRALAGASASARSRCPARSRRTTPPRRASA